MIRSLGRVSSLVKRSILSPSLCSSPLALVQSSRLPVRSSQSTLSSPSSPLFNRYLTCRWSSSSSSEAEASSSSDDDKYVSPSSSEKIIGKSSSHEFQAETKQLLNIVAKSLYTDKEVFVRELISNASDALEKRRHDLVAKGDTQSSSIQDELCIRLYTDEAKGTLTIQDNGIGLSSEEMVTCLGTIASSGSRKFVQQLNEKGNSASSDIAKNIIGQFGVGFYSSFMASDDVHVYSRSQRSGDGENAASESSHGYLWRSEGAGKYDISEAEGVSGGTKVILHLRQDSKIFSDASEIERIIKKYSNFVGFPIYLNGKRVNTIQAIWTQNCSSVTFNQHKEFYRYVSHAYDDPLFYLHYSTDVPFAINSLIYFPSSHMEKFGMGRQEPGVSIYSRKILIESKSKRILPDWLRFVKGVIDCEDIPLNISREHMQDSALIKRIRDINVKKIIKYLVEQNKSDANKYNTFYDEFSQFLKEGVCTDFDYRLDIAKLLKFDSSNCSKDEDNAPLISFDDYISRMKPDQKHIYYLAATSRNLAEQSPYYELFKKKGVEVLFLYKAVDEFVMSAVREYETRSIMNIERSDATTSVLGLPDKTDESITESKDNIKTLTQLQIGEVSAWFKQVLSDRVDSVTSTTRLVSHPAVIVDHESAAVRTMMRVADIDTTGAMPKQKLHINPNHEIIVNLYYLKDTNKDIAEIVAQQLFDNCLIAAGLLDDSRTMLGRLTKILGTVSKTDSALKMEKGEGLADKE